MGPRHGGILCDISDAAMGMAFASTLAPDESFTTIELKVNFSVPCGRPACEPRVEWCDGAALLGVWSVKSRMSAGGYSPRAYSTPVARRTSGATVEEALASSRPRSSVISHSTHLIELPRRTTLPSARRRASHTGRKKLTFSFDCGEGFVGRECNSRTPFP